MITDSETKVQLTQVDWKEANTKQKKLNSALAYGRKGLAVFPCYSVTFNHGVLECECGKCVDTKDYGKHPRTEHGVSDATTDQAQIRTWWKDHPTANIGVKMGPDMIGIDFDDLEWWEKLSPDAPKTFCVKSPNGYHLYYMKPASLGKLRNSVKHGGHSIDIRTNNGYLVGHGSTTYAGVYRLQDSQPFVEMPEAWIEIIKDDLNTGEPRSTRGPGRPKNDTRLLEAFCNGVEEGERDDTMFNLIAQRFKYSGLPYDWVYAIMEKWNNSCPSPLSGNVLREKMDRVYPSDYAEILTAEIVADVDKKPLEWIWKPWLPKGKLTILGGEGEIGKSFLLCDLVARITKGRPMPDDTPGEQGLVLWLSEETVGDVIRPRLEEAGADLDRVVILKSHGFTIKTGLWKLEELLEEYHPTLFILDPIESWSGIDGNSPHQVRTTLDSFSEVIDRYMVGAIGIRHLAKMAMERSINKIGGATDWLNTARSVLGVDYDPAGEGKRIMAHLKSNNAPKNKPLSFTIEPGQNIEYARIQWHGDIEGMEHSDIWTDQSQLGEAMAFLAEFPGDDGRLPYKSIIEEANVRGITKRTLDRAKARKNLRSKKMSDHTDWIGKDHST